MGKFVNYLREKIKIDNSFMLMGMFLLYSLVFFMLIFARTSFKVSFSFLGVENLDTSIFTAALIGVTFSTTIVRFVAEIQLHH